MNIEYTIFIIKDKEYTNRIYKTYGGLFDILIL